MKYRIIKKQPKLTESEVLAVTWRSENIRHGQYHYKTFIHNECRIYKRRR